MSRESKNAQRQHRIHQLARRSLGLFWLYQGLVPKIISPSPEALGVLMSTGIGRQLALDSLYVLGLAEIGFGLLLISGPSWRSPLWLSIVLAGSYVVGIGIAEPRLLIDAFSSLPVSIVIIALSVIALRTAPPRKRPVFYPPST